MHKMRTRAQVALFLLVVPLVVGAAECDSATQRAVFELVNRDRAANGRAQLGYDPVLGGGADGLAEDMANGAPFAHPPIDHWCDRAKFSWCAENLGKGASLESVHAALQQSPPHWANIVAPEPNVLGTGYAEKNGTLYVVHRFAKRR